MKTSMFIKTFLMLLISFSLVFFLNAYISNKRFAPMYIDENVQAIKESIMESSSSILSGEALENTTLINLSSETSFIRYQQFQITEEIGPGFLTEEGILDFVITLYDNEDVIIDGQLSYYVEQVDDIYNINYIYEYEFGDYLIVKTKIQSLTNVDRVLQNINTEQTVYILLIILVLSFIISRSISKPLRKINIHAKNISNLDFTSTLNIKRNDEFKEITSSLNEMTFNLQKAYIDLESMNQQLSTDLDHEKIQEQKKKDLIMTINHEIKTPLAVIKGMVEGMIDGVGRYKDKDTYLNRVLLQIETIENITKDLNYTLKLEDKKNKSNKSTEQVLMNSLSVLTEFATSRNITIQASINEATLIINDELLDMLFSNIVKNAILYTKNNKVQINTESLNNHYIITVKNKGHINQEDLDSIFDSYYRSKNESTEGSGLGLYIVKQICTLYKYEYKIYNDNQSVVTKIKIKCH